MDRERGGESLEEEEEGEEEGRRYLDWTKTREGENQTQGRRKARPSGIEVIEFGSGWNVLCSFDGR